VKVKINFFSFFSKIIFQEWKGINRKQSTRLQHLSRLKASAFFSLQIFLVVMKQSNLYLGLVLPSGGWQSLIVWNSKFGNTAVSMMTLSMTTLSITVKMRRSVIWRICWVLLSIHYAACLMLCIIMLSVILHTVYMHLCTVSLCWLYLANCGYAELSYSQCNYAEFRYAKCCYAECCYAVYTCAVAYCCNYRHTLSIFMLNVVMSKVERQLIEAAIHRSGNSSNAHRGGNSSNSP
jgi:hypothetical protein